MEFGKILKVERTRQNLSQSDLALKLHVARQTVSKWENGDTYPNLDVLVSLSEILNVSSDTLLKGENNNVVENLSNDVKKKKRYKGVLIGIGTVLAFCIVILGVLTWGRQTQNETIDRINPFLKTQTGYAVMPLSNGKSLKPKDIFVVDDPFGSGEWLKTRYTGAVEKDDHVAIVKHKGSFIFVSRLITKKQLPAEYSDIWNQDYYPYEKNPTGGHRIQPSSSTWGLPFK
ncbi:helix-turn-helix domain-containing protein [Companilactobacillus mishanensis]|uniref:Helix-turn-helix domain-containing protein n=1 Tax=Companilactobacillus mishanensis TaxID=2486008 RepID=A0A5P0ZII2_9LACO|nr:helix-turn-helix domain-containing protein [Companilactobacillus mishanensis]MQS52832.1 helix-turn-helix domain-containing protein [Companilactobacillus mishanensis]